MKIYKKNGFTMVELIVVIMIVAIVSIFITIRWSHTRMTIDSQIELFASDIRYLQNLAMSRNDRPRLVIYTGNSSYQITDSDGTVLPLPSGNPINTLMSGISYGAITNIVSVLTFDGRGIPYTDTTNPISPLSTEATINLTSTGGEIRTVHITPQTGRVYVTY